MSSVGEVRYAGSSGTGEMSSSGFAQVRVRVRVRERMKGGLGENERVREWVCGIWEKSENLYLGFFLKKKIVYMGRVRAGYA